MTVEFHLGHRHGMSLESTAELLRAMKEGKQVYSNFKLEGVGMNPINRLTENERSLIKLIADGYTHKEIADATGKASQTVKNTMTVIRAKLDARNSTHAVAIYLRWTLTSSLPQGIFPTNHS